MFKLILKPLLRAVAPFGIRELKKSQAIWKMSRVFLTGGSIVDVLQELTKLTEWEWDEKMLNLPANELIRNAIDNIDGKENVGVEWYDFFITTMRDN